MAAALDLLDPMLVRVRVEPEVGLVHDEGAAPERERDRSNVVPVLAARGTDPPAARPARDDEVRERLDIDDLGG